MYAVDSYSSDFLVIHSILLLQVKMTKINSNHSRVFDMYASKKWCVRKLVE